MCRSDYVIVLFQVLAAIGLITIGRREEHFPLAETIALVGTLCFFPACGTNRAICPHRVSSCSVWIEAGSSK